MEIRKEIMASDIDIVINILETLRAFKARLISVIVLADTGDEVLDLGFLDLRWTRENLEKCEIALNMAYPNAIAKQKKDLNKIRNGTGN